MEDGPQTSERFKPAMPCIPGVNDRPPGGVGSFALWKPSARIGAILVAALVVGGAAAWWAQRTLRRAATAPASSETSVSSAGSASTTAPRSGLSAPSDGLVEVAAIEELGKPWASKRFLFRKRFSGETIPATVVRLPGGAAGDSASYWAFSLQAPFERCELEYVTDLSKLASQYGYGARHAMVANPCSSTLYDPLRLGTLPNGAWARGEVVQGSGIRPPIAIEIQLRAGHLVATRIE